VRADIINELNQQIIEEQLHESSSRRSINSTANNKRSNFNRNRMADDSDELDGDLDRDDQDLSNSMEQ